MTTPNNQKLKESFEVDPALLQGKLKPDTNDLDATLKNSFTVDPATSNLSTVEASSVEDVSTIVIDKDDEYEPKPTSFLGSPVLWILVLLLVLGGLQTYGLIENAFSSSLLAGTFWSIGLGLVLIMVLISIYREFSAVLMLRAADVHRLEVKNIVANGNYDSAMALCKKMAASSKITKNKEWQNFLNKTQSDFDVVSVFSLYEQTVLQIQDQKAKKLIIKRATENGVIVALSPVAWLDMFLTLARSLRLIREISMVYGLQCGIWGRMQLYRRVIHNLIFIGMADLATDALVDVFGAGAATKISASIGQGVAAAIYSSRLGYMTVKAVRPLPVTPQIMTLGELRRELLTGGELAKLLRKK